MRFCLLKYGFGWSIEYFLKNMKSFRKLLMVYVSADEIIEVIHREYL